VAQLLRANTFANFCARLCALKKGGWLFARPTHRTVLPVAGLRQVFFEINGECNLKINCLFSGDCAEF
jgi:hypothetical protein